MTNEVKLPQMGESIDTGTVLSILVKKGDEVEEGQGLIEVETDKATAEIPSPQAGVVGEIHVEEGDEVETGQLIVTLSGEEGRETKEEDKEERKEEDKEERKEEDKEERKEEDKEEDKEHDKEERKKKDEKKDKKATKEDHTEEAESEEEEEAKEEVQDEEEAPEQPREAGAGVPVQKGPAVAAPSVRRFARELGVDVADVAGAGRGGQVTKDDVKAHVRELLGKGSGADGRDDQQELPDFSAWGKIEREPMSAVRRTTAAVVRESWRRIPHVTQFDRADITDLDSFRERFQDGVEAAGGRLTLTAILLKVAAEALGHFPRLNASVDEESSELIIKRYVHVGVAVDTDAGLVMPVLRDADRKDLTQVAVELHELAGKAREGKVAPDDLQGASFTITNLGGLGTTVFTPIVPWPQAAILAVGRAEDLPALRNGALVSRQILPIGLSYDHRCVDGADAARFLRFVAESLEEPMRMVMEPERAASKT